MRAIPSFTSRTVPTSSTSRALRSAASISRRRMSLISPGRSVVSVAIRGRLVADGRDCPDACEKYHKVGGSGKLTWRMGHKAQLRITPQRNDDGPWASGAIFGFHGTGIEGPEGL